MASFYAYKESRINLDPAIQGSTVQIRLPASHTVTTWTKAAPRRSQVLDVPIAEDEKAFKYRYLASAASIYHRQHHGSPKSFLWRVLEDAKVLSINVVDFSKQTNTADANLTLRLIFPSPVRSGCVAFSDSPDHDVLSVFVLLESNHLYTLTLRPEYFRKASSIEDNAIEWCKIYSASAFGIASKTPHRLAALTADELLISQYNGELLRLTRKPGSDGSDWAATQHSEGGVSFRSMIRWGGAATNMKYGNGNIEFTAATSIATPSTLLDGSRYAFVVSLDHKLRVWNFSTNKIVYMGDILNQEIQEGADAPKQVIHPSASSQLVKVYGNANEESALCVTYSPLGTGEFKFWSVRAIDENKLDLVDLFPNNKLEPSIPSSDLWTLADFAVVESSGSYTVWVLWKNNISSRVQSLTFDTDLSVKNIREKWRLGWSVMATETLRDTQIPSILPGSSTDVTDKWLQHILSPGKFSLATLESSLTIYEQGIGSSKETISKSASLPERMCSIIASNVNLGRKSNGQMGYDEFRTATDEQWHRFYRLILELDKHRGEALSMVVDLAEGIPWVVLSDGVIAVRACSDLEIIWHNQNQSLGQGGNFSAALKGTELVVPLVRAAAELKDSLSDQMLSQCRSALLGELFEEPALVSQVRLRNLYDKCDFANQVGDDEFDQLKQTLGGTFADVTPEVYTALITLMTGDEELIRQQHLLPLAEFGNKLIVKGVQEVVELHRNICLDQLILLILIESEINFSEDGIAFDTAQVFEALLTNFKRLELINWLASTQMSLPLPKERSSSISGEKPLIVSTKSSSDVETLTVLEGVLRHLLGHDIKRKDSLITVITEVIVHICDPLSTYELQPSLVQCFLLKHGRPDLAVDFSRFTLFHPFDIYIQGRVQLALNAAPAASRLFKKAAYGIGVPDRGKDADFRSGGFLDMTERNLFNAGLPQYYSHIVALYDREKVYSFVIEFARLALQFIKPSSDHDANLRTDLHSRLFNAAIQTSRWDLAHSFLSLFTDTAIQHSALRTLVTKMCETSHATHLLDLPFLTLQSAVDAILTQKCASTVDLKSATPYHKILYAWRVARSDFRGAAAVSLQRLQRLKNLPDLDNGALEEQYIALLNALGCVDPKNAWILSEELVGKTGKLPVRKVVTLQDIRKEYQAELDRIAAIENNQFLFAGEEMDVDTL